MRTGTLFILNSEHLAQCLAHQKCTIKVCYMNEKNLALVAMEGAAPPVHPQQCYSPALGGLQLCGHLVLTELPHSKSGQRLVCPEKSRGSSGDEDLAFILDSHP